MGNLDVYKTGRVDFDTSDFRLLGWPGSSLLCYKYIIARMFGFVKSSCQPGTRTLVSASLALVLFVQLNKLAVVSAARAKAQLANVCSLPLARGAFH